MSREQTPLERNDSYWAERIRAECHSRDTEADHARADRILIQILEDFGYPETIRAWEAVRKWYA